MCVIGPEICSPSCVAFREGKGREGLRKRVKGDSSHIFRLEFITKYGFLFFYDFPCWWVRVAAEEGCNIERFKEL